MLKSQRKNIALKLLNIIASISDSEIRNRGLEFNKPQTFRETKPGATKKIISSMLFNSEKSIKFPPHEGTIPYPPLNIYPGTGTGPIPLNGA
jgi:hypothetical protein